jgi:HNH endonuclease
MPKAIKPQTGSEIVARARRENDARALSYREQALKLYPWVCGRCAREFTRQTLPELTVHHRDHDHDNNPEDGSNWELLCIYCHDDEHARHAQPLEPAPIRPAAPQNPATTFKPFADLKSRLRKNEE